MALTFRSFKPITSSLDGFDAVEIHALRSTLGRTSKRIRPSSTTSRTAKTSPCQLGDAVEPCGDSDNQDKHGRRRARLRGLYQYVTHDRPKASIGISARSSSCGRRLGAAGTDDVSPQLGETPHPTNRWITEGLEGFSDTAHGRLPGTSETHHILSSAGVELDWRSNMRLHRGRSSPSRQPRARRRARAQAF